MATQNTNSDFLGAGWMFPLSILDRGLALAEADQDVLQSVLLVLGTSPGERVMLPDFGCALNELVFAPMNEATQTLAATLVRESLERWEPRITGVEVEALPDSSRAGVLNINIGYVIRASNVAQNLVYPFYLEGGGDLPPGYNANDA